MVGVAAAVAGTHEEGRTPTDREGATAAAAWIRALAAAILISPITHFKRTVCRDIGTIWLF
jgi:hypothetical protein